MKRMKIRLIWLFCFATVATLAQEPIEVKVEERPSSMGIQPAFEVVVPQATPREAIDLWKKTITPRRLFKKKPKMEKVKDEWQVNNVVINEIVSRPLSVITQVSDFPGHIYIRIFLHDETGFIGADSSAQTFAAKNYIRSYGVELYRLAVGKELKAEEHTLNVLERELNKLIRKNKTYADRQNDAERESATLQEEAQNRRELVDQSRTIITGDPEAARDAADKELKSTEKELKKAKKAVSRYERKGRKNDRDQKDKVREIERQMKKVEAVRIKLDNIR